MNEEDGSGLDSRTTHNFHHNSSYSVTTVVARDLKSLRKRSEKPKEAGGVLNPSWYALGELGQASFDGCVCWSVQGVMIECYVWTLFDACCCSSIEGAVPLSCVQRSIHAHSILYCT